MGRKWKKIEGCNSNTRVAFLGSASLQLIVSVVRAMLARYDVFPDIYEGEFNGIYMDAMDLNSNLYSFKPDYIIIIPDFRDIENNKPQMLMNGQETKDIVEKVVKNYLKIFTTIHSSLPSSQILFSNFVCPIFGNLGNLEANYIYSEKSFFSLVNISLITNRPSYVNILDMDGLAGYIGKADWFDESAYYLNKAGFSLKYIGYVGDLIARQFEALIGKTKKCIVLDLDNTLWGGVVGDVGCLGINLDPNDAEGEAYLAFQEYLLELKKRGVILAVCSKNDIENAKEPFEKNPLMVLKLEDISSFIANWNDKASNIKMIAQELNIGTDSLVFFDDNPTERELVKEFLPEVKVIDVPGDPALFVRALNQAHVFEWNQLTEEDVNRVKSYADNQKRTVLMDECVNYEEYLERLEMRISISEVNNNNIERFSQLTNKSNQFNLRTQRYSEAEIIRMMENPNYILLAISMEDKFSNYGIIACVVLKLKDSYCTIENWVMSCRVLKKTVENYTIQKIVDIARKNGIKEIRAEYQETKKNNMVSNLYDSFGFELISDKGSPKEYILKEDKISCFHQKYYFREDN